MATSTRAALATNPAQDSPWDQAIQLLRPQAAEEIRLKKHDKLQVLAEVLAAANAKKEQMRDKQWKYTRSNGTTVVFRDIFDKIALRLSKLKDIGDTLTQVDPLHAGVPWGVIKFFLQATVAETEKLGVVFDGIEMIVGMISKYGIFEQLYLGEQRRATQIFRTALVRLYASILSFLAEAKFYYAERTGIRVVKSAFHIGLSKMVKLKQEIQDEQVVVIEVARLIDAESLRTMNGEIKSFPAVFTNLRKAVDELESPMQNINDQLEGIVNRLERIQIFELLGWISTMPYTQHHETVRSGRLESSGLWLFNESEYIEWRKSQSSSLLWLHGMPGSGKSKLVSLVIDTIKENKLNTQTEALAHVYCTQSTSESERAEPVSILRSIVRQLSSASKGLTIREPTVRKYQELQEHGFDLRQLTLDEVKGLILELLVNTPTTIVIDALDECNPKRRFQLVSTFTQLLQAPNSLVKILVSSREPRLPSRLETLPTFRVDASQTTQDIDRFVDVEVRKAINEERLLGGIVSASLEARIISTLKNGAQGMFLWVSLQIQNLCDPEKFKLEEDVLEELGRLPQELCDVYSQICNRVIGQRAGRFSRKVAETALRWLLCAQRALSTDDFVTAVYFSATEGKADGHVSKGAFLDICGNLLIADKEQDVFRFFHSSVREFLQTRPDFSPTMNHATAAEICINTLLTKEWLSSEKDWHNASLRQYVALYWAVHLQNLDRHRAQSGKVGLIMAQLSVIDIAPQWFVSWLLRIESVSIALDWNDPLRSKVQHVLCDAPVTTFFLACSFGFTDTVHAMTRRNPKLVCRQNARNVTGLHLASQFGYTEIVALLLANGSSVNKKDSNGGSPLHLASIEGFDEVVAILLQHGADPAMEHSEYGTALQAASLRGHDRVVRLLVKETDIDSDCGQFGTALQAAALRGHSAVVGILLDAGADVNSLGGQYKVTPQLASTDTGNIASMARVFRLLLEESGNLGKMHPYVSDNYQFEAFVQLLIDQHVDINIEKEGFGTALQAASRGGHADIVKSLLDKGADVNIEAGVYGTAIQAAAVSGHAEVVAILLKHGADVNSEAGIYNTALQAACRHNHRECFNLLLDNGAYVDAQGGVYGNALQAAVRAGSLYFIKRILCEGGSINACGGQYGTALQAACSNGSLQIVDMLIDQNADLDIEGGQFGSALQSACANGHLHIVQRLVDRGARFGRALQVASLGGHEDIVCLLMAKGLDPNAHEGAFGTALQMAAVAGREQIVHLLTQNPSRVDFNYETFGTALQVAAATGNHNIVRLLLDKGADPSIYGAGLGIKAARVFSQDMNDTTLVSRESSALEAAAASGYEGIVRTILEWYLMNGRNDFRVGLGSPAFLALSTASKLGHTKIVELLLENGVLMGSDNVAGPLQWACQESHARITPIFLDLDDDPNNKISKPLLEAIEGNHIGIIALLLDRAQASELNWHHVYEASYQGNLPLVRRLLESPMSDELMKKAQSNPLLPACFQGHDEIVKLLLGSNADTNQPVYGSSTDPEFTRLKYPLHAAAFQGHEQVVKMLLSSGAFVNNRGGTYETALIAAAFQGHARIVQILIENGADPNLGTNDRQKMGTALQAAAYSGHATIVQLLLESSADINAIGGIYGTAIQAAASSGCEHVVRLLIQWGANVRGQGGKPEAVSRDGVSIDNFENEQHWPITFLSSIVSQIHSNGRCQNGKFGTALQAAAVNGNARIVRLLLEHGADAGDRDMHGQTPLHRAAYHGHQEVVSVLLEYGTVLEAKDVRGRTALSWVAFWGYDKLLDVLSHGGACVDEKDSWGKSALHQAAFQGQLKIIKSLLHNGANLECTDGIRCTPLFSALEGGRLSSVCFLLNQGSCVTHRNSRGLTVLHEAVLSGYNAMIRPILAAGLDINVPSAVPDSTLMFTEDEWRYQGIPEQSTPLHLAATLGNYKLCYILMLKGANVEARNSRQETPLHLAVQEGTCTVVSLLLKWGALANSVSLEGTPIYLAAMKGHDDIVQLLVEKGADIDCRDAEEGAPLHAAAIKRHPSTVACLLNKRATLDVRNSYEATPLHLAAVAGCHETVKILVERGANLEARDDSQKTPLHYAAAQGNPSVVVALLDKGAAFDARDRNHETPLHYAAKLHNCEVARLLIHKGGNSYAQD